MSMRVPTPREFGAARCLAYSSSADLPIPASPRTTSAAPIPAWALPSRVSRAAHSAWRPSSREGRCWSPGPVIARMVTGAAAAAQPALAGDRRSHRRSDW